MAATSRRSCTNGRVIRSLSPSSYSSSTAFAYSSSSFASRSSNLFTASPYNNHRRSTSPPRVNLCGTGSTSTQSVRFSLDRPISPNRSITYVSRAPHVVRKPNNKKACMCSPTTHPGSFRCSLHKNFHKTGGAHGGSGGYSSSTRLNARRSAMTNSLVRISGVEGGDLVKRALSALIRPSSHQQRRRAAFQPRPSRLSVMTKADDLLQ